MSQPSDRRRPAGRSPRRFDGPAGGRAAGRSAGSGPPNRPFGRAGGRPARPGAPRPDREGRDGEQPRGRGGWETRPRRSSEAPERRPEGGARPEGRGPWQPREERSGGGGAGWGDRRPRRPEGRSPFPARRGPDRFSPGRPGARPGPGPRGSASDSAGRWSAGPEREAGPDRGEGENYAGAAPSDLIWGRHAAQAVLESGRPLHRVWCTPEMRFSPRFLQLLREAKASGALVEEVTWARLGQISGGAVHQGIVLQPAAAETLDLETLIDGCRQIGEAPLLLAVDGLTDPQNLGAIVRSAEALGAHGLVLPQRRNAGLTGTVAKVAAGALEHLPIARVVNLNRSLEALREEGYRVIGLAGEGTVSLEEADLDGPLVVVTGSEGDGLSLLTRRHCDQLVRIPLRGSTPSLNASVATALLLYEVARRSWMKGLTGSAPAPRLVRPALPAATVAPPESFSAEREDSAAESSLIEDSPLEGLEGENGASASDTLPGTSAAATAHPEPSASAFSTAAAAEASAAPIAADVHPSADAAESVDAGPGAFLAPEADAAAGIQATPDAVTDDQDQATSGLPPAAETAEPSTAEASGSVSGWSAAAPPAGFESDIRL